MTLERKVQHCKTEKVYQSQCKMTTELLYNYNLNTVTGINNF